MEAVLTAFQKKPSYLFCCSSSGMRQASGVVKGWVNELVLHFNPG